MADESVEIAEGLERAVAELLDLPEGSIAQDDNLIELGLDSIATMKLAGEWRAAGLNVRFADLVSEPTLGAWRRFLDGRGAAHDAEVPGPAGGEKPGTGFDATAPFPLALMQHAYWVGRAPGQRLGGVAAHFYNEFDGSDVDPERLDAAVRALLERHGMLRVRILDDGTQRIPGEVSWPGLRVHDLRAYPADQAGRMLAELRRKLSHRSMDIATGEVFDVQLSLLPDELRERGTRLHVNLDMVAADALSLRILLGDLAQLYAGKQPRPLDYSYPRYLAARARADASAKAAREYWRERLPELPGAPQLPASAHAGDAVTVVRRHRLLAPDTVRRLEHLSRRHGLTTAMTLAAVFAETLTAWSAEPRFLLNLPLFDREPLHPDVGALVGDFTSSVLLAWDGAAPGTFAERAALLQRRLHADVAHAAHSGVEVLRDASRLHGEQVLAPVVYTSALGLGELFPAEVRRHFGEASWIISQGPQVWLDAQVTELDGGLLVNWDAREDAFAPGVLDAMFDAYGRLLDLLLTDESAWSRAVPPLLSGDQAQVRERANDTAAPRSGRRLHDAFFAQAGRTPQAPAIRWGIDGSMTYGELAARAFAVAGHLCAQGVRLGEPVAVSLPKGPNQVIAVLGVLAAGAAYLPLGVDQPVARRARILAASGVRIVLDDLSAATAAEPADGPVSGPDSVLAYVLYTSGSTGEPKGVEIPHSAAVNTIEDLNERLGLGPGDRSLALSALEFDLSVYDIFGPLSAGGAVICVDEDHRRDAVEWAALARRHHATVLNCVPALLDMLLTVAEGAAEGDGGIGLRAVLLGGDWVTLDLPPRLAAIAPGCRFAGLGGTTETAIHSTFQEVEAVPAHWTSVPYGKPLRNVRCRVVDALGHDRPDWVPGELWIGGEGVALGYRGDPDRTADRFVEVGGTRWYRTGDRARYWPDGTLEFLGREDHQVKIRGHRIELGEIESALTAHPRVVQGVAVVTPRRRLAAAVVVTDGSPDMTGEETIGSDTAWLREFLATLLPVPMLPDRIAIVPRLPLTQNGKVDRATISRTLDADLPEESPVTPPSGEVETLVAAAWREILDVPEVGREHEFFALGGDSLLATRLISRLRAAGLRGVALSSLFTHPALADFAATLRLGDPGAPADPYPPTPRIERDPAERHQPFPPTEVQRAYWLGRTEGFTLGGVGCHFYREYDVTGLDVDRLQRAVNRLVRRHEMLRAVFDELGDQRILAEVPPYLVRVDEAGSAPGTAFAKLRESMSRTVFDPRVWPLFAIRVVRAGDRARLAIGIDNLILDALSILTFYAELATLYEDPDAVLPPLDVSFRDHVLDGQARARDDAARAYWDERLGTLPQGPRLPLAKDPTEIVKPVFTRREATLGPDRWQAIVGTARAHGMTPSGVLLAAFAEVLGQWSAQPDLTVNLTLFDRGEAHPHIDRVLGDFTSLLLIPCRAEREDTWLTRARRVQAELWGALDHRQVSAVQVLRALARHTGEAEVTMPVVFTSTIGVGRGLRPPGRLLDHYVWGISQTPQVWLDHQAVERVDGPGGARVELNWDAVEELFPPDVLDDMFAAYLRLLEWISVADWRAPVPSLLPERQREVRRRVNATAGRQQNALLHTEFFRLAAARPDAPAVIADGRGTMSYGELAERALRVASLLSAYGIGGGDVVGVTLPKGPEQIEAVLGVLAAGAAYVPVGVDQPPARRNRMYRSAGVRLTLTDGLTEEADDPPRDIVALPIGEASAYPPAAGPVGVSGDALAYVIFTSGSTGEPKGVEITHRAAANTIEDINARFAVGPSDRVLAVSALDFDLSVYDVFGLLSAGGTVVTIAEDERRDARRWAHLAARHGVSIWNTVPMLLDMLLVALESGREPARPERLRLALASGDWVGLDLPGRLGTAIPGSRLVALGGATEASIWSNAYEADRIDPGWRSIPYGYPLRNQNYRVVDGLGRDRPDWAEGELWIGGAGVARGYRNAPELTARRFVTADGDRWYRTGDLGRYRPGGEMEFLGRTDHQVKIRGNRVELGEIESVLAEHERIAQAVVVLIGQGAARRPAAVIVPASGGKPDVAQVRSWAETRLPAHMTPERIVVCPALPLTANGKIDRSRALELVLADAPARSGAEPPEGETEQRLAALWESILHQPVTDRDESFFSLGGDSVTAMRFIELAARELHAEVPLSRFFATPTIRQVAEFIAAGQGYEEGTI